MKINRYAKWISCVILAIKTNIYCNFVHVCCQKGRFIKTKNQMLNQNQIEFYQENGYLLLPNYASKQETSLLKSRMKDVLKGIQKDHESVFTTDEQTRTSDEFFLNSGDKVRCFFEDKLDENGNRIINKIGHALHDLDEVYQSFSYQDKLLALSKALNLRKAGIIQSQYIFKEPKVGGKVTAHTDSTFIYTDPLSCAGVWIALEKASTENACLWVLPKSHKFDLKERFVRNETNDGTIFIDLENDGVKWNLDELIPVEANEGDAVILHGSVVHLSYLNESNRSRHAYIMHLIDTEAAYPSNNWLQRADAPIQSIEKCIIER